MYQSYEINLAHRPDFKVRYRFYQQREGGRKSPPYQGYRSDFWYFHEQQPNPKSMYMIWPEFEDEFGNLVVETDIQVAYEGTARMWIIAPVMRVFHKEKIKVGLKAYFMEGSRQVAECEVIELLDLQSNPTA